VLGNEASTREESHSVETDGLLEYPHYTRPAEFRGKGVPEELLSGHHAHIEKWRRQEAERRTQERRPELFARYEAKKREPG
jgi:tRNA (guanine37-N1)-methyltransferase